MAVLETVRRQGSIRWSEYVHSRQGKKVWVCSKLREQSSWFLSQRWVRWRKAKRRKNEVGGGRMELNCITYRICCHQPISGVDCSICYLLFLRQRYCQTFSMKPWANRRSSRVRAKGWHKPPLDRQSSRIEVTRLSYESHWSSVLRRVSAVHYYCPLCLDRQVLLTLDL